MLEAVVQACVVVRVKVGEEVGRAVWDTAIAKRIHNHSCLYTVVEMNTTSSITMHALATYLELACKRGTLSDLSSFLLELH